MSPFLCLLITLLFLKTQCKVSPINQARYVEETNSFVVTCRLSQLTTITSTRTTCDFLVDLKHVPSAKQSLFRLSNPNNQWIHNPEQWVLIRPNKSAIHSYTSSYLSSPDHASISKAIMDKIMEFPSDFNQDSECFALSWYTHYSEDSQEIQFRILITQSIAFNFHKTCTLYPWSIIHPTFLGSHLTFEQNFIQIRFCTNEIAINDAAVALKLRQDVQWRFVSVEITHIYDHVSDKNPVYFLVADITDGIYRWYVWKSSVTIQRYMNESLSSLESQFAKFHRSDHFAQSFAILLNYKYENTQTYFIVTSMLLTQKARDEYPNTTKLAQVLTESDVINKKEMLWYAHVPVWDPDVIRIGRFGSKCHLVEQTDDIFIDISSFKAEYHPNFPGIKRNSPQLPPQGPLEAPTDLWLEDSLYKGPTFGIHPIESSDSQDISTDLSGVSPASESEESRRQRITNARLHDAVSPLLEIYGGPDILYRNKLHVTSKLSCEIFEVPRRGTASYKATKPVKGRRKYQPIHSRSSSAGFGGDLIPSVIHGLTVNPSSHHGCDSLISIAQKDVETRVTPGLNGLLIQNISQNRLLDTDEEGTDVDCEDENVRVVILYEGHDYGREALIIASTGFVLILILSCIGFACVISEQMVIKRRKSTSPSSANHHSPSSKKMSPQRKRKSDLY